MLEPEDSETTASREHGGSFSLDSSVRIEGADRSGRKRLLRCCARPAFALERLRGIGAEHLVCESIKLGPGGSVSVMLTPLELTERLAALIPPPRRHRHRYDEVLAPKPAAGAGPCARQRAGRRAGGRDATWSIRIRPAHCLVGAKAQGSRLKQDEFSPPIVEGLVPVVIRLAGQADDHRH